MSSSTSLPFVSPRSYHSTVTDRCAGLILETIAEWTRPEKNKERQRVNRLSIRSIALVGLKFFFLGCWCLSFLRGTHVKYFLNHNDIIIKKQQQTLMGSTLFNKIFSGLFGREHDKKRNQLQFSTFHKQKTACSAKKLFPVSPFVSSWTCELCTSRLFRAFWLFDQ